MDTERLQQRVAGRKVAQTAIELVMEELTALHGESANAFWEEIRDRFEPLFPKRLPSQSREPPRVVPMLASEVVEFEKEIIDFGQFHGETVGAVMRGEPRYLEWLAGQDFTDKLRRYLANEQIASEMVADNDSD